MKPGLPIETDARLCALFPSESNVYAGNSLGYASQFRNPMFRRTRGTLGCLDTLFPQDTATPSELGGVIPTPVWRDTTNRHRYYTVINGRIRTFLTHERDHLLRGLSGLNASGFDTSGFSSGLHGPVAASVLAILLAGTLFPASSWALPTGESVQAGNVTFNRNGKVMTIHSGSHKAIVNYDSFNIAGDETVNMNLPSSSAAILNRVTGGSPSEILGNLNSNGNVFLVNPSGIVFGAGSQVNVGSLTASTLNISNQDFLDGNYRFTQDPAMAPAAVVNHGTITTAPGGYVVLAGGQVTNTGNIYAPGGTVDLAVGSEVQINVDPNIDVRVSVDDKLQESVDGYEEAIANTGAITAHHINAQTKLHGDLYETAVNNAGRIEAESVAFGDDGSITFGTTADGETAIVNHTGELDAGTGHVSVDSDMIFHSGTTDAGSVELTASQYIQHGGTITAKTHTGDGSSIILDSQGHVDIHGTLLASSDTGAGGTIDVSAGSGITMTGGAMLDASGNTQGGSIQTDAIGTFSSGTYLAQSSSGLGGTIDMGGNVSLLGATVDSSGETGGGTIRIGGEFQGGKNLAPGTDEVTNATEVFISQGTDLLAQATGANGDGGEVIIWADNTTHFYGSIDARPGTTTGNGGFVEVSAGETLNFLSDSVQTGRDGRTGNILLDPKNIYIQDAPLSGYSAVRLAFGIAGSPQTDPFLLNDLDRVGISTALNDTGDILALGSAFDDTGGSDRGAVYLFNLDTDDLSETPTLRQKIVDGTDGITLADDDNFGFSLALDGAGDTLAVGANGDDTGGANRGAVYLFQLNSAFLPEEADLQLKLTDGMSGLTLTDQDFFGSSVALNSAGDILAVGATGDDTGGTTRGAAYLFNLNSNDYTQAPTFGQKIAHGAPAGLILNDFDQLGNAVALNDSGNILAIGAFSDNTGGTNRGAAYLFNLNTADLTEAATLEYKLADGSPGVALTNEDKFGSSLALNGTGNILAVGVSGDDTGGSDRGAIYLFNTDPGNLSAAPTHRQTIAHGTGGLTLADGDSLGYGLALNSSGSILTAGAPFADTGGADRGAVHLFSLNPNDLTQVASPDYKIAHGYPGLTIGDGDNLGVGLSSNSAGDIIAIGAWDDNTIGNERGAVYLFSFDLNNTSTRAPRLQQKILDGTAGIALSDYDFFGTEVSLNGAGDILAVGAYGDDTNGGSAGSVYLLGLNPNDLTQAPTFGQKINHGTAGITINGGDQFGRDVSLNSTGDILAVGAPREDTGGTQRGSAFLFTINPGDLTQAPTFEYKITDGTSGLSLADNDRLGWGLDLNGAGDILAIGAYGDDTGGSARGAVYLMSLNTADLTQAPLLQKKINHGTGGLNLADGDLFGAKVALNDMGNLLAVGAPSDDNSVINGGAVHVLNLNVNDLTQDPTVHARIQAADYGLTIASGDLFGYSVDLNGTGDLLLIGHYGDDTGGNERGGALVINMGNAAFGDSMGQHLQFAPATIESLLSTGNNLTLQASNDIFVNDDITVNNIGGNGGHFTLQAGRSLNINADITTDNGDLTLIANDYLANGVIDADRDPGAANITMATGTRLDAGSGIIRGDLRNGSGKTHQTIGNMWISELVANQVILNSEGSILNNNGSGFNLRVNQNSTLNAKGYIGTLASPIRMRLLGGSSQRINARAGAKNGNVSMSFMAYGSGSTLKPRTHLTPRLIGTDGLICWNGACAPITGLPETSPPIAPTTQALSLLADDNTTPPFLMEARQNPWHNGEKAPTEGGLPTRPGQEAFQNLLTFPDVIIENRLDGTIYESNLIQFPDITESQSTPQTNQSILPGQNLPQPQSAINSPSTKISTLPVAPTQGQTQSEQRLTMDTVSLSFDPDTGEPILSFSDTPYRPDPDMDGFLKSEH